MILNNMEAIKVFHREFKGQIIGPYIERRNKNFLGKTVGFKYRLQDKNYLVTFRPRGITSYTIRGIGAVTGMNGSEIEYQIKHGMDRIVLFQENGSLYPLLFKTEDIMKSILAQDATAKEYFKNFPNEDETVWNIPVQYGINLRTYLSKGD